jgi:hypothetical protein
MAPNKDAKNDAIDLAAALDRTRVGREAGFYEGLNNLYNLAV